MCASPLDFILGSKGLEASAAENTGQGNMCVIPGAPFSVAEASRPLPLRTEAQGNTHINPGLHLQWLRPLLLRMGAQVVAHVAHGPLFSVAEVLRSLPTRMETGGDARINLGLRFQQLRTEAQGDTYVHPGFHF